MCTREIGGCGTSWNTFETRGICPECNWHWEITQCHSCQQFSLHTDWYHDPSESPASEVHEPELAEL
ncbi:MAG TPA: hypothetical protein VEH54_00245 [Steroidobacteraceae bacterium]|nr:hypothetical protein [Steroidobacteraceae bacterium]